MSTFLSSLKSTFSWANSLRKHNLMQLVFVQDMHVKKYKQALEQV